MQRIQHLIVTIIALSVIALSAEPACPRGALAPLYCDRDGDMLADPPIHLSQSIDPYELVFAYSPVEDPTVYKKAWQDFVKHLSRITGKRVVFFLFSPMPQR